MIATSFPVKKQETDFVNTDFNSNFKYKMKILKGWEKNGLTSR